MERIYISEYGAPTVHPIPNVHHVKLHKWADVLPMPRKISMAVLQMQDSKLQQCTMWKMLCGGFRFLWTWWALQWTWQRWLPQNMQKATSSSRDEDTKAKHKAQERIEWNYSWTSSRQFVPRNRAQSNGSASCLGFRKSKTCLCPRLMSIPTRTLSSNCCSSNLCMRTQKLTNRVIQQIPMSSVINTEPALRSTTRELQTGIRHAVDRLVLDTVFVTFGMQ